MNDVYSVAGSVPTTLTRRHYAGLSLGLVLFIVYGCLLPFNYQPLPWAEGVARFRVVCDAPVRIPLLSGSGSVRIPLRLSGGADWLANFLLVLPLGYLLMGALVADRGPGGMLAAPFVFAACLGLSVGVEFAQLWFPPRVSDVNDIVAQSVGATVGIGMWVAAGQRITRWARRVWLTMGTKGLAVRLLPGYLALLAFKYGMPFNLTLSPADLYHKWRDGHIQLVPFAAHGGDIFQAVEKYCWTVALFLPIGLLLANVRDAAWQSGRNWWRVLALGVAVASLIQVLKLFVLSRYVDGTEVVVGSLAVLAGWGLVLALRQPRLAAVGSARHSRKGLLALLLIAWVAAAVLVNWQPFDFTLDARTAAERLSRLPLLPFADYESDNPLNAFDQFVKKVLLFVPLGALLTLTLSPTTRGRGGLVLLVAAVVAAGFEAGQLFLPTRYPSVTDVLVESSGAWVGLVVTRRARSLLAAAPPSEAVQAAA